MHYRAILFLLALSMLLSAVDPQMVPLSPCPDVFQYENESGRWSGKVEARTTAPDDDQVILSLSMTLSARLPSKYVGSIEPVGNRNLIMERMRLGWPVVYRINFPMLTPLPQVVKIVFNGATICTGASSTGRFVTAIHLEHTLKVENRNMAVINDGVIFFDEDNEKSFKESTTEMPLKNRLPFDDTDEILDFNPLPAATVANRLFAPPPACGEQNPSVENPLVANGHIAGRGEWPWLTAMFVKKPRGLEFTCAGSLISNRLVLTAAHCVVHRTPGDLILKIGVYNLQDWTDESAITRAVSDIKIHPNAEQGIILTSDIAVLVINKEVVFSEVIQPVCLWDKDDNQAHIIGRLGSVIGWGRDERGVRTTLEPRIAKVPIVSTEVCRASRKEFFQITTKRTLCAGARDGSGPCNGDSGGGLYLQDGEKWYLRGIISNSLKDPVSNSCNLYEFIVYTDAAKYTTWIKNLEKN